MNDLTLLYYTANRLSEHFAASVRESLRSAMGTTDAEALVCVLQQERPTLPPAGFYAQRCVVEYSGHHAPSIWQVYQNILQGARAASTPFIACCEDDTVYAPEHFAHRPALDTFAYDRSRWVITKRRHPETGAAEAIFYWRERHQMAMCIAPRELLIETLEEKFAKYPVPPPSTDVAKKAGWGEPGRYEKNLCLTSRKMEYFDASRPSVTFNHDLSLMGRRQWKETDIIKTELEPWGNADALWSRIHG